MRRLSSSSKMHYFSSIQRRLQTHLVTYLEKQNRTRTKKQGWLSDAQFKSGYIQISNIYLRRIINISRHTSKNYYRSLMQDIFTNRYLIFSVLLQRFPAEVKNIQIKIENIYSVKHSFSFLEHQTLIISLATDGTIHIMMTLVTRVQMSTGLSLI